MSIIFILIPTNLIPLLSPGIGKLGLAKNSVKSLEILRYY
jgi:hypothetical protein